MWWLKTRLLARQGRSRNALATGNPRHNFFDFLFDAGGGKREKESAMKPKDLFFGLCVAAVVITESIFLLSARQQRTTAEADLRGAQHQVDDLKSQVAQLKADNEAAQATDIVSLRAENKNLSQKFSQLQGDYTRLDSTNKLLVRQLDSLRQTAVQLQERVQQWETYGQQATATVQQETQAQAQARRKAAADHDACIKNLKDIDTAKQKWALLNNKTDLDIPTEHDLLTYLPNGAMPACPGGGTYSINAVGLPPTCTIPGHAIQ